jgi:hypothetical protein
MIIARILTPGAPGREAKTDIGEPLTSISRAQGCLSGIYNRE